MFPLHSVWRHWSFWYYHWHMLPFLAWRKTSFKSAVQFDISIPQWGLGHIPEWTITIIRAHQYYGACPSLLKIMQPLWLDGLEFSFRKVIVFLNAMHLFSFFFKKALWSWLMGVWTTFFRLPLSHPAHSLLRWERQTVGRQQDVRRNTQSVHVCNIQHLDKLCFWEKLIYPCNDIGMTNISMLPIFQSVGKLKKFFSGNVWLQHYIYNKLSHLSIIQYTIWGILVNQVSLGLYTVL